MYKKIMGINSLETATDHCVTFYVIFKFFSDQVNSAMLSRPTRYHRLLGHLRKCSKLGRRKKEHQQSFVCPLLNIMNVN